MSKNNEGQVGRQEHLIQCHGQNTLGNRVHDMLLVACCDDIVWGCGGAKLTKGTDLKEQGTSQLSEKLTN